MNLRRTRFISPLGISLLSLAFSVKATRRIEARTDTHAVRDFSRHAAPDEAGLVATRDAPCGTLNSATFADAEGVRPLLVNGAASARTCIGQIGRSAARSNHYSQATFNSPPAADALSRRWGI